MSRLVLFILLLIPLLIITLYFSLRHSHTVCVANCLNKPCGDDGCGGQCPNTCPPSQTCQNNHCVCVANCAGKACGDDGCGGQCPNTCTGPQQSCNPVTNQCQCTPNCEDKECGDDGCGGTCANCPDGQVCKNNTCICVPNCVGKACGPDGCGGECPNTCTGPNQSCDPASGQCQCVPNCVGKMCGPDGCGGQCTDKCAPNETCNDQTGQCICIPNCSGTSCGPDGCGGQCNCPPNNYCNNGVCCVIGKCNENCPCPSSQVCNNGVCCSPSHSCDGRFCGDNGCGQQCNCPSGYNCTNGSCVCAINPCGGNRQCGTDNCGNICGNCGENQQCVNGVCQAEPYTFNGLTTTDNNGNSYALYMEGKTIPASGPIPVLLFNMNTSQPTGVIIASWTYDPIKHTIIASNVYGSHRTLALTTTAPANSYCAPYPTTGSGTGSLIDTDYSLVVDDYVVDSPRFERWTMYSDGSIVDMLCSGNGSGNKRCIGAYSYSPNNSFMYPTTTAGWSLQCKKFTGIPAPPAGILNPNSPSANVLTCQVRDGSQAECPVFDVVNYTYNQSCANKNVTAQPNPNWTRVVNDQGQSACGVNPYNSALQGQCCDYLGDSCFDTTMSIWCNTITPYQ